MVAASGVILLPHSRGPLSDSAALCRCGGAGNTHLLISAGPFLPCPAPLRPGQGDGAQSPSRGCPASAGTAEGELCQRILNFLSQSPAATWASPMGWHWSISALYPNQFAPAGGKLGRQLQTSLFPLFPHSVSPFESDNSSDLAPQLVGEAVGAAARVGKGWELHVVAAGAWDRGTHQPGPCRKPGESAAPLLQRGEGIPQHSPSSGCRAIVCSPLEWEVKEEQ